MASFAWSQRCELIPDRMQGESKETTVEKQVSAERREKEGESPHYSLEEEEPLDGASNPAKYQEENVPRFLYPND